MILGTGSFAGEPVLLVGLSHENLARLVGGEPILTDLGKLDGPWQGRLAIIVGETEEGLADVLGSRLTDG